MAHAYLVVAWVADLLEQAFIAELLQVACLMVAHLQIVCLLAHQVYAHLMYARLAYVLLVYLALHLHVCHKVVLLAFVLHVMAVVHAVPAVLAVLVSLKSNFPVVIKGKWEAIQEPILKLHNLQQEACPVVVELNALLNALLVVPPFCQTLVRVVWVH